MQNHHGSASAVLIVALALIGCGKSGHELDTAPVTGIVKIDGTPATSGFINVVPSKGRMARGTIESDGSFTLSTYSDGDGAQIGTHAVTVTEIPPDQRAALGVSGKAGIPSKYGAAASSGLSMSITPDGPNKIVLELESEGPKRTKR